MHSFCEQVGGHVDMGWGNENRTCVGGVDVRSSCRDNVTFFRDCAEVDLVLLGGMSTWFARDCDGKRVYGMVSGFW